MDIVHPLVCSSVRQAVVERGVEQACSASEMAQHITGKEAEQACGTKAEALRRHFHSSPPHL